MIAKYLKEPLLHFLVLGGLIFALYGYINGGFEEQKIVISKAQINQLIYRWQKKHLAKPSKEEIDKMVENAIYKEVMSREAIKIGLDINDHIIKRRLVQKMEFVSSDLSLLAKPTTKELKTYLQKHSERFRLPPKIDFISIYLNPSLVDIYKKIKVVKDSLNIKNYQELSDPFMLDSNYKNATYQDISRKFGKEFASKVFKLEPLKWSNPIKSGYGIHFVYITKKTIGKMPKLDSIKEILTNQYMGELREKNNRTFYQNLRKEYKIEIDNGK